LANVKGFKRKDSKYFSSSLPGNCKFYTRSPTPLDIQNWKMIESNGASQPDRLENECGYAVRVSVCFVWNAMMANFLSAPFPISLHGDRRSDCYRTGQLARCLGSGDRHASGRSLDSLHGFAKRLGDPERESVLPKRSKKGRFCRRFRWVEEFDLDLSFSRHALRGKGWYCIRR